MEVLRYMDRVEGFRGWAVFHASDHLLAAGGLRVQPGLQEETVVALAGAMALKERLLGLAVDGAKAGIDYDPGGPGKPAALARFLDFLRDRLTERLSLGPDMGSTWPEVERAARAAGLVSAKAAVARAQGLDHQDFLCRLALLDKSVGALTLAQRRAGHALAHAAVGAARWAAPAGRLRAAVQGFGTLGRGTSLALAEAGVAVTAVADEHGCLWRDDGLDVAALLAVPQGRPVTAQAPTHGTAAARSALLEAPVEVLVLAACENAVSPGQAMALPARAVAVGANLGLSPGAEMALHRRGVAVVPDFVGGCGGSASMDALFGPPTCPAPEEVLDRLAARMRALVAQVLGLASDLGVTPRQAALAVCEAEQAPPLSPPYGRWALAESAMAGPGNRWALAESAMAGPGGRPAGPIAGAMADAMVRR